MVNIYKLALQVQDASNISGVIHSLATEVLPAIRQEEAYDGTRYIAEHPAVLLFLDKIVSLTHQGWITDYDGAISKAYAQCHTLGEGVVGALLDGETVHIQADPELAALLVPGDEAVEGCPECDDSGVACFYCGAQGEPVKWHGQASPVEEDRAQAIQELGAEPVLEEGPTKPYAYPLTIDWHCLCGDGPSSHVSRASGEECFGHCQTTDRNCRGFGYRPIDHSGRTPAISAIFEAAGRLQMPKHYTCDLSTDYQSLIGADAPTRFLWIVRESGTHLYSLDARDTQEQAEWQRSYVRTSLVYHEANHTEAQVFHWNGFTLNPVNYDTAKVLAVIPGVKGETLNCHGATWHNAECTHRVVSTAPDGDHTHGPGVMVCSLCSRDRILAARQAERQAEMDAYAADRQARTAAE